MAILYAGDAIDVLQTLPEQSCRCCVTSPPYWGLRDYGTAEWEGGDEECDHAAPLRGGITNSNLNAKRDADGNLAPDRKSQPGQSQYRDICGKCGARRVDQQLGLESTPDKYVEALVGVFREVRRVLTDDGTLWLNLGDSYAAAAGGERSKVHGLKPKDLVGIPWSVAFALRADGWWLRQDIIWAKPNPMPESVRDRCTKAHEYVFLLAKSERYYYDAEAISDPSVTTWNSAKSKFAMPGDKAAALVGNPMHRTRVSPETHHPDVERSNRNRRTVWTIPAKPYPEAHFATFPPELAERCIKAGSAAGDTVLDPFGGSGTVASVAVGHGRSSIYIDLNPEYLELAQRRIGPMLCEVIMRQGVAG